MKCHIYNENGTELLREEEREPKCGIDFCDNCGDCLYCYGDEFCPDGLHRWVVYDSGDVHSSDKL